MRPTARRRSTPPPSARPVLRVVIRPAGQRGCARPCGRGADVQDAHALQALVVIGAAVIGFSWLATRLRVAAPIVLLLGAVPLALLPWTSHVLLAPEVVLLLFLPALLYWESLTTSLREIRANLRVVIMSSVLLVLATAGTVAVVGHALGLSWSVAWVLGA